MNDEEETEHVSAFCVPSLTVTVVMCSYGHVVVSSGRFSL